MISKHTLIWPVNLYAKFDKESFKKGFFALQIFLHPISKNILILIFFNLKTCYTYLIHYWSFKKYPSTILCFRHHFLNKCKQFFRERFSTIKMILSQLLTNCKGGSWLEYGKMLFRLSPLVTFLRRTRRIPPEAAWIHVDLSGIK